VADSDADSIFKQEPGSFRIAASLQQMRRIKGALSVSDLPGFLTKGAKGQPSERALETTCLIGVLRKTGSSRILGRAWLWSAAKQLPTRG
jgi:hypothetical protein